VFLHIPKTAGQFVLSFLHKYKTKNARAGSHVTYDQEIKDGTKPYLFVRNPWDWYVSRWVYNLYCQKQYFKCTFKEHLKGLPSFDTSVIIKPPNKDMREFIWKCRTLEEWCSYMSCGQQISIFAMENIVEAMKNIVVIENINLDDEKIEEFCTNTIASIPHPHYRTYYDEESKELVCQYDKEIIEKFNYSF